MGCLFYSMEKGMGSELSLVMSTDSLPKQTLGLRSHSFYFRHKDFQVNSWIKIRTEFLSRKVMSTQRTWYLFLVKAMGPLLLSQSGFLAVCIKRVWKVSQYELEKFVIYWSKQMLSGKHFSHKIMKFIWFKNMLDWVRSGLGHNQPIWWIQS